MQRAWVKFRPIVTSAFVVNFFVMSTDAGGITTIATARSKPLIPGLKQSVSGDPRYPRYPRLHICLQALSSKASTAAGKDWFLARLLCLYYYRSSYAAFFCPVQTGKT